MMHFSSAFVLPHLVVLISSCQAQPNSLPVLSAPDSSGQHDHDHPKRQEVTGSAADRAPLSNLEALLVIILCHLCISMTWFCIGRVPTSVQRQRLHSFHFLTHLQGAYWWVLILIGAFWSGDKILSFVQDKNEEGRDSSWVIAISYILCWITSLGVLVFSWLRIGKPNGVKPGLVAVFFLTGGLLGFLIAGVFNSLLMQSWEQLAPDCNPKSLMQSKDPKSPECNLKAAAMWVLTTGLVEETFKGIWLFARLCPYPEDLPGHCCFGCLPASHHTDCGCWYKLAPTPYHVLLCALASGAGFQCLGYACHPIWQKLFHPIWQELFGQNSFLDDFIVEENDLLKLASIRMFASGLHMAWTALIGLGLCRRLFLPANQRPSLLMVLLPSMIAHGLFDFAFYAWRFQPEGNEFYEGDEVPFLFVLLCATSVGFGVIVGQLTGCVPYGRGFCCMPGFWESQYLGEGEPADTSASTGTELAAL